MENSSGTTHILVCDIGGTNLRECLAEIDLKTFESKIIRIESHTTNDFKSFHEFYTSVFIQSVAKEFHPTMAVLGIAGAVYGNKAKMTNIIWGEVDGNELAQQLNLKKVLLVNDLEAIGLGVLTLKDAQLIPVNNAFKRSYKPIYVMSPGTGFGGGFLVPDFKGENSYEGWASESGHANHGPVGTIQHEYYNFLRKKYNLNYVWIEKMVCGYAILDIYEFFKEKKNVKETLVDKEILPKLTNDIEGKNSFRKAIFEYALNDKDEISKDTLNLFIEILATEASNAALRFLPYSGLYIVGNIINYIADYLIKTKETVFFAAYFQKEKILVDCLEKVPIFIVKTEDDTVGLKGCIKKLEKNLRAEKTNDLSQFK